MGALRAGKGRKFFMARFFLPVLVLVFFAPRLWSQAAGINDDILHSKGDPAAAERYRDWAERAIAENRWGEALTALERASDFASVSSDLSYLLALARSHAGKSRGAVLEALERARQANRWGRYTVFQALERTAEQYIGLRNYSGALAALSTVPESADADVLRLRALKGLAAESPETGPVLPALIEFRRRMLQTMDRYPRDSRPLRILFEYARKKTPDESDQLLMEIALRRLPFLLEEDPDLSWMASPFIRDIEEARRLTAAYRAGGLGPGQENFRPDPASIPAALNLGLIDDSQAAEELFGPAERGEAFALDRDLIAAVHGLLRAEAGRDLFTQKLLAFSGLITFDEDGDGIPESRSLYSEGILREYRLDSDQDGLAGLVISCNAGGEPLEADQVMPPDGETDRGRFPAPPIEDSDRSRALVFWERYPSVLRVELGETTFIPRPGEFQFAPVRFSALGGSGRLAGLPFPLREFSRLNLRTLISFSHTVRRPSAEFEGAVEHIDLDRDLPLRAVEILNGRTVSETEFENGAPLRQRLDLDLDGRMETRRRFRRLKNNGQNPLEYRKVLEFSESDWDGDGIYEAAEEYREDGSIVYSWDMDKDGIREYSEKRAD
jgi:hypothetical protein